MQSHVEENEIEAEEEENIIEAEYAKNTVEVEEDNTVEKLFKMMMKKILKLH